MRNRISILLTCATLAGVVYLCLAWGQGVIAGELRRMTDESWAGGPVSATLVDAASEELTFGAARIFREVGLSRTSGLPCYQGFNSETPIHAVLASDCVYTHFLPGPEYAVLALMSVFGESDEALMKMRIVPLTIVLGLAALLVLVAAARMGFSWPLAAPLVLAALVAVPGLRFWSLSLYGHSYSNACILAALTLGLAAGALPTRRGLLLAAAFVIGALSNLFLLEGAFVVFVAPLVGALLAGGAKPFRLGARLSVVVGLGLLFAFVVHLLQVAHHLQSLPLALEDQLGTALLRAESRGGPGRLALLLEVSEETALFYGLGALPMLLTGLLACWLSRATDGRRGRYAVALLLAAGAALMFPLLLKHHSVLHLYRVPRVFLLLFVVWLLVWLSLLAERYGVSSRGVTAS
ncbi:MAG: hypothetical protein CMP23_14980 [Rickettsiales bacterium]|nr:hypothetical protein [Rickettsiales bacterium]